MPIRNYQIYNVLYFYVEGEILSNFQIYAKSADANEFETSAIEDFEHFIPKEGRADIDSSKSFNKNFLAVDTRNVDDFVMVSVRSERKTMLTMMSTYKENIKSTLPKPFATQIYKVETEGDDSSLLLSLPSDKNYEMYIQTAYGSMMVYSRDEDRKSFVIKGTGDSVLINFNANEQFVLTSIEILALEDDSIFYVDYRPRFANDNLEDLKFGASTEISFDDIGFPCDFYARIPDNLQEKDYVVNIKYKGEKKPFTEEVIDDFIVRGAVVDYKFIQRRQRDKTKQPTKKPKPLGKSRDFSLLFSHVAIATWHSMCLA